jgi:hypothetical protein
MDYLENGCNRNRDFFKSNTIMIEISFTKKNMNLITALKTCWTHRDAHRAEPPTHDDCARGREQMYLRLSWTKGRKKASFGKKNSSEERNSLLVFRG